MNAKQVGLAIVLAGFAALNGYAFYAYGPTGFFRLVLANGATVAVVGDLVIALTMVAVWMSRDAAQRSVSVVPYLLLTVALGSIGPLLYLIERFGNRAENPNVSILHPRQG